MRTALLVGVGLVGLALGAGAMAATSGADEQADKQRRSVPAPLRPLTDADQTGTRESGCQLSFEDGNRRTLVYAIGNSFLVRTRAGLQTCRISEAQFGRLSDQGTQSCGGYRIAIRRTGRVVGHQETDSAAGRARLTVTGGGRTWTTNGMWGSAC